MGLISTLAGILFGSDRNVVRETVEMFHENAEAGAKRAYEVQGQAMTQFGAEFAAPRQGGFDRFMDGLNRVPRPAMALGTLALLVCAMTDPLWFAARMQGLALVPEPLWWLLGVIVSFYFGARQQFKSQNFQREIAATVARAPAVVQQIRALQDLRAESPGVADPGSDVELSTAAVSPDANPALEAWKAQRQG